MSRPWMPLYVADYLADTSNLKLMHHGAYLLLIMHYWQKGYLPDDDEQLASIARATPEQWSTVRPLISEFFEPGWRHARIDEELEKSRKAYEKRASAGRSGGNAKAAAWQSSSNARAMPEHSSTNHNHNHIDSYPASQHSYGGAATIDLRMPDLLAALGVTDETKSPGLLSLSEPIRWVEGGCDIDADIIPALREIAARGKTPRAWSYCSNAVFEARDRRLKPAPEPSARAGPGRRRNFADVAIDRFSGGEHDGTESVFGNHGNVERVPSRERQSGPDDENLRGSPQGRITAIDH